MKTINFLKGVVVALLGVGMMAGSAMALPTLPSEWGIISPTDITGPVSYTPSKDFGYYIWTDDEERLDWHIRWMAGGLGWKFFNGNIQLENNTGVFAEFSFEGNGPSKPADYSFIDSDSAAFFSWIKNGQDGIDFTIAKTVSSEPSYVGFDLKYQGNNMDSEYIFLGSDLETVASLGEDEDFAIAAPVPEPATMLLFGAGLIGLAGVARKRKMKK